MNRRDTLLALGVLSAAPLLASAQQAVRVARIGYLSFTTRSANTRNFEAFQAGLRALGYVEGKNIQIESRHADGDADRLPALAAELVGLNVDVIVTYGATGVLAARRATATIPIVFATGADPVALGFAASLARPGGNVTGSAFFIAELMAKRLELLKETKSSLTRVGVLQFRGNPANGSQLAAMRITARALKVQLHTIEVRGPAEFEWAFSVWAGRKIQGIVVSDHAQFNIDTNARAIATLAATRRLPLIGSLESVQNGGLMAYGVNFVDMFRRTAVFVDKILKGAKPGDLPIEQATRFELVVNLKIAKEMSLTFPQSILVRVDRAIE